MYKHPYIHNKYINKNIHIINYMHIVSEEADVINLI